MRPDADKVFATRAEAEAARDRLNETPPELGWSPWYLGGPVDGEWWVIRSRGVIAEDLEVEAHAYEQTFCALVRRSAGNRDFWRDAEGIRIEDVRLDGAYPETQIVLLFRAEESTKTRFGKPTADCLFGYRCGIWPAEYVNPEEEAYFFDIYLMEFLGTDSRAFVVRGARPCDPDAINWLT
jgi:hypothetical protein